MKLQIILGFLCVGFALTIPEDQLSEDEQQRLQGVVDALINATINKLVSSLPETIAIESLPLNFSSSVINGDASITNLKLTGLKDLVATKIDVSVSTLAMNATIIVPEITLNTKYAADVVVADLIPLYGDGRVAVVIDAVDISLGGKVTISPLSISNVTVQIGLDAATFDLHGLLNNEDFSLLLSQMLTDNVATFLNTYKEAIGNIISPIAQQLINALLGASASETSELFKDIDLNELE